MSDMTKPMAHEEAEKMKAVDLYLLNELSEDERIRFEEHYFDCMICAEAVEAGQVFIEGVEPPPERVSWWGKLTAARTVPLWQQWALGGVTALSLIAFGWQQRYVVSPLRAQLSVPQANTVIEARGLERGDGEENTYKLGTPSVAVTFDLPSDAAFFSYRVSIKSDRGKPLSQTVPRPANEDDRRLSIQVGREVLGSGHFTVTVEGLRDGQPVSEVGKYYFTLKD
jgi:hypothetical protein